MRFLFLILLTSVLDFTCSLLIKEGTIERKTRFLVSTWIMISGFVFLVVPWKNENSSIARSSGWIPFLIVTFFVIAANLLYGKVGPFCTERKKKYIYIAGLSGNLAILGFFKYFNFFIENLDSLLRSLGMNPLGLHLNLILPVGISFYTFMSMSYTIDVYKNRIAPVKSFTDYALFVSFFPKLLAGPIERAANFLPQIQNPRTIDKDSLIRGAHLIFIGLFKKVVIADGVAQTVQSVFGTSYRISWTDAMIATILFTFQIYGDFSGYSDIATGLSSLLGFRLSKNFNHPYFSRNPSEFWGRWHISLSSWFRDYVFFPLGGPYGKTVQWIRNVLLTFFVTGLWHGASWNYIVWGLYHGVLLCLYQAKTLVFGARKKKRRRNSLWKSSGIFMFFILTSAGWVIFRSHSMAQVKNIFEVLIFGFKELQFNAVLPTYAAILGLPIWIVIEWLGNKSRGKRIDEVLPLPAWTAVYAAMIFLFVMSLVAAPSEFIYFVF
ncbi:MAG: MBOAT family protein [Spirochaetales bacterium]|nr:MAG: MBOAT family protein [Spirochaetales bacterium]